MRITAALGIFLIVLLSAHARAEVDWPPKRTNANSGHRERSVRCIVNGSGRSEATLVVIC